LFAVVVECFFAFTKHDLEIFDRKTTKELIRFSAPMMASSVMLFLLNNTAIFILGALSTASKVGVYNLASKLSSLAMLVIISMNIVLAPKISELFKSNKMVELHQTIKSSTWLIIGFTIPIVLVLIFFSEFILSIFGTNFISGKSTLIILAISVLLNVSTGNVDQILNMTNNQKTLKNLTFFGFVLNVLLNFFLIPKYGIDGAAIAGLLTTVCFNFSCLYCIKQKLGFYTFM
jgi:O-antigen/teichoic acid export membrane protein